MVWSMGEKSNVDIVMHLQRMATHKDSGPSDHFYLFPVMGTSWVPKDLRLTGTPLKWSIHPFYIDLGDMDEQETQSHDPRTSRLLRGS